MKLTRFLGRSPDTATNEDLRDSIEPTNSLIGITRSLRTCATAVDPRCQINMTP